MCLYRLRAQQTQRQSQLRVYWCSWAGQEAFPFWLTQAAEVSRSHGTVKFPHLGQDCVQPWLLFSVDTERAVEQGCWAVHWTVVFLLAGWSVSLPAEPWPPHKGEGWDWILQCLHQARCSEPTAVQPAKGVLKLASALCSTGWTILAHTYWGCIQFTARDHTITLAFLLLTLPALFSTRQDSRMTRTICILDVQRFARLPASRLLPFCHVPSMKLGTKGIRRPAEWSLPPLFTEVQWKHDCSVLELISGHSCLWDCAGALYPLETVAWAVGIGCRAMQWLTLCQAKQLGLVHWIKQTVAKLLGSVWLSYGRWYTEYNGLRKYSEWGKCHS